MTTPACIELFHLRRVRHKAAAVQALMQQAGLSETAAWAALHQALGGQRPHIALPDWPSAHRLIQQLAACGFVARRAPVGGFDAAQHAAEVLADTWPACDAAFVPMPAAALLQGHWAQALEWALQHLQMHRPPQDAARQRLEQAALEAGLVCGVPGRV